MVLNGAVQQVKAGSVVNATVGMLHAIRATTDDLYIIEVQTGDVLAEEDIERFGNFWE